ncbi:TatD family hydrolase [Candidatus Symbiobacter mobilis]|uniref:Mg-dependent DNase n=1 Tax=Candidatus Symbiobacter mobilis CR TaxID=946483 RepID=U5N933_9BURK|nr:TatD family hydrolase [Candidatus Symbiobacter mobilis]AGX86773.1 Mg-dependent DNase [Candidatus Symbiobacter mobilis CR]
MYCDSHCHLDFPELLPRLAWIRDAMRTANVGRALCVATKLEGFETVYRLASECEELWCTVGVHPDYEDVEEPFLDTLVRLGSRERVVGVGETGLDYSRLGNRSVEQMQWQRDRFCVHIRAARSLGKPLVVHMRSATDDTLRLLQGEGEDGSAGCAGGVFHCFTETADIARKVLDMGFHISLSGILTFKNAVILREVAAMVPLDRVLIETDSPYLAPVPHRGKVNDPSLVCWVGAELARIKGIDESIVAEHTTRNFERLFLRGAATSTASSAASISASSVAPGHA